eukprot:gene9254-10045_t
MIDSLQSEIAEIEDEITMTETEITEAIQNLKELEQNIKKTKAKIEEFEAHDRTPPEQQELIGLRALWKSFNDRSTQLEANSTELKHSLKDLKKRRKELFAKSSEQKREFVRILSQSLFLSNLNTEEGSWRIPKRITSASAMIDSQDYDFASYPLGPEVYFDRPVIQQLLVRYEEMDEKEVLSEDLLSKINLSSMLSFRLNAKSLKLPENAFTRPNLDLIMKTLTDLSNKILRGKNINLSFETKKEITVSVNMSYILTKDQTYPEPVLCCTINNHDIHLLASEAKSLKSSVEMAIPQATLMSGECCFDQYRLGFDKNQVLVPFIITAGLTFQFGCTYLIDELFPCSQMISRPYYLRSEEDLKIVRKWILTFAYFLTDIVYTNVTNPVPGKELQNRTENLVASLTGKFFYKPIMVLPPTPNPERSVYAAATRLLHIFYTLSKSDATRYIHYPIGTVGYPSPSSEELLNCFHKKLLELSNLSGSTEKYQPQKFFSGHPFLVYEDLRKDGWKRGDELLEEDVESFLDEFKIAISLLKESGVVLTDIRLSNLFYKFEATISSSSSSSSYSSLKCRIKFIDLDDAYIESSTISPQLYQAMQSDYRQRYPLGSIFQKAIVDYYQFFLNRIESEIKDLQTQPETSVKVWERLSQTSASVSSSAMKKISPDTRSEPQEKEEIVAETISNFPFSPSTPLQVERSKKKRGFNTISEDVVPITASDIPFSCRSAKRENICRV